MLFKKEDAKRRVAAETFPPVVVQNLQGLSAKICCSGCLGFRGVGVRFWESLFSVSKKDYTALGCLRESQYFFGENPISHTIKEPGTLQLKGED